MISENSLRRTCCAAAVLYVLLCYLKYILLSNSFSKTVAFDINNPILKKDVCITFNCLSICFKYKTNKKQMLESMCVFFLNQQSYYTWKLNSCILNLPKIKHQTKE